MSCQGGVVCVVWCQCDVETGGQQEGACHRQKVQDTGGGGTRRSREKRRSLHVF